MKLRRLKQAGIDAFAAYLNNLKSEPTLEPPIYLLTDTTASESIASDVDVDDVKFATRFDAAEYLDAKLVTIANPEGDEGMWAWLALFYFDQLAPKKKGGIRKLGKQHRLIPEKGFQVRYRHLLRGAYLAYHAYAKNPELVRILLVNDPSTPGELYEQIASRQDLITNPGLMGFLTSIYWDENKKGFRRGAAGAGPGSSRRISPVLDQFDLTYDLFALTTSAFDELLPAEFDKFREAAAAP